MDGKTADVKTQRNYSNTKLAPAGFACNVKQEFVIKEEIYNTRIRFNSYSQIMCEKN